MKVLVEASERLGGRQLRDEEGFEGMLEVSLAPYQGVPKAAIPDQIAGTFESSEFWKEFITEREESGKPTSIPLDKQLEVLMERERELHPWKFEREACKMTPLLAHIKKAGSAPIVLTTSRVGGGKAANTSQSGKNKKKKKGNEDLPTSNTLKSTPTTQVYSSRSTEKQQPQQKPVKQSAPPAKQPQQPLQNPAQKHVEQQKKDDQKPPMAKQPVRIMTRPQKPVDSSTQQQPTIVPVVVQKPVRIYTTSRPSAAQDNGGSGVGAKKPGQETRVYCNRKLNESSAP